MLVLVASLYEFLQFLKIVMWISIPLFLVSTLVVVLLHYRKKKKNILKAIDDNTLQFAMAGSANSFMLEGSLQNGFSARLEAGRKQYNELENGLNEMRNKYTSLFSGSEEADSHGAQDRSSLEKQLTQYELKISQLQQAIEYLSANTTKEEDFERATATIADKNRELARVSSIVEQLNKEIALLTQQNDSQNNEIQKLDRLLKSMQETAKMATNDARDLQLSFHQQTEDKDKGHFEENQRLAAQLKELYESFKKIEEENSVLQQKLQAQASEKLLASKHENKIEAASAELALEEAKEEIRSLKNQLVNTDCLEEILSEKKSEIQFLQQQLEQRIRTNRASEQKWLENEQLIVSFKEQINDLQGEIRFLVEDMDLRKEEFKKQQQQIEEGSLENRLLKKQLLESDDKLLLIVEDNEFTKKKLTDFENEIIRNKDWINHLHLQLEEAKNANFMLNNRIQEKQDILTGIHRQLSEVMNEQAQSLSKESLSVSLPFLVEQATL